MDYRSLSSPLGVGGVHGDGMRQITGSLPNIHTTTDTAVGQGCFFYSAAGVRAMVQDPAKIGVGAPVFSAAMVVPTANKVQPRAWGALACVYLGAPK